MTEPAAALVFAEPSCVIRIWNSAAESLFGHGAAEAIGQTLDLIIPPEYRARHWAGFRAAMAAGDGNIDHSSFTIPALHRDRSEEHTSELQSLMRISYAGFCLQKT